MSDKKQSPSKKLADREAKNKARYDDLVKKAQLALEHHSPGVWDWIIDKAEDVKEWGEDVVDSVNDGIDKYIWDADQDEAVLEGWVRDAFDIPDQEGKGFLGEVGNKIWDYGEDLIGKGKEQLDDIPDKAKDAFDDAKDKAKDALDDIPERIGDIYNSTTTGVTDLFNKVSVNMPPINFTFLEPLLELPGALVALGKLFQELFTFDPQDYDDTMAKLEQLGIPKPEGR